MVRKLQPGAGYDRNEAGETIVTGVREWGIFEDGVSMPIYRDYWRILAQPSQ